MEISDAAVEHRIARLYAAVDANQFALKTREGKNIVLGQLTPEPGGGIRMKFNDMTPAQVENQAWDVVHNVATFFEYMVAWAKTAGIPFEEVAAVRKNSLPIRIIQDLHNIEKHQKNRPNQSGVWPDLVDIRRPVRVRGGGTFTFEHIGNGRLLGHGDDVSLVITGQIVNFETKDFVGELSAVVDDVLKAWEKFLTGKGKLPASAAPALPPPMPAV